MATRNEIVIEINSKTGDMTADVACGPGGAICESMLADVLGTLGGPSSKEKRPEFYQKRVTVQNQPNKR